MFMNRRVLATGLLASFGLVSGAIAEEPFPIFTSEILEVDYRFRRREVAYETSEPKGTVVVDPGNRFLYYVLGQGRAIRYGVGVGNRAASWSGIAIIKRKVAWPTWTPTSGQLAAHPVYSQWINGMPGGTGNPLGARAMYLFQDDKDTLYRIHGTEVPSSIGKAVSSGCIRMINADVADLYDRVDVGTRVIVLDDKSKKSGLFF
jgi:lipoprotein-anchoring transpeptidase ErfK/SrfK